MGTGGSGGSGAGGGSYGGGGFGGFGPGTNTGGTGYGGNVGAQGTAGEKSGGAGGSGMAGFGGGGQAGVAGSGWGGSGGGAGAQPTGGTYSNDPSTGYLTYHSPAAALGYKDVGQATSVSTGGTVTKDGVLYKVGYSYVKGEPKQTMTRIGPTPSLGVDMGPMPSPSANPATKTNAGLSGPGGTSNIGMNNQGTFGGPNSIQGRDPGLSGSNVGAKGQLGGGSASTGVGGAMRGGGSVGYGGPR